MRKELGMTYEDTRHLSIPRIISIFETYIELENKKYNKSTGKSSGGSGFKDLSPEDLESEF